jgi:carboxylesterase type B
VFVEIPMQFSSDKQNTDCICIFFFSAGSFDDNLDDNIDTKDDVSNDEESRQKYPVMVFIHGESFSWGSGKRHFFQSFNPSFH